MATADVAAIQTYLKNTSSQVSAAVQACASLDQPTVDHWYDLAGRILAYVSEDSPALALGRSLRTELNSTIESLSAKGCGGGKLAELIAKAPPPKLATKSEIDQGATKNPLLTFFEGVSSNPIAGLALVLLIVSALKGKR